jgi:hypothetical protein
LLLETASATNLILQSENLATTWITFGAGAGITQNSVLAPSGLTTADTITPSTTETSGVYQHVSVSASTTYTFSFYARRGANYSPTSNNLNVYLATGTGTDQNVITGFTGNSYIVNTTAALTTTWTRYSYTATVGVTATQLATYFTMSPTGTAGAADFFEVTGVQLEVGSVATPFHTYAATIQGELSACQRYYETRNNSIWSGNVTSGSNYYLDIPFAVVKRGTPTITLVTTGINGFPSISAASINTSSYRITGTANTTGSGCFLAADLWTASAEL